MKNLKFLLCALVATFLAAAAQAQNWSEWKPFSAGGQVAGFSRVAEMTSDDGNNRHMCQFTMNENLANDFYAKIRHVKCNNAPLEGWVNLGLGKGCVANYTFRYDDAVNEGRWDWDFGIVSKTDDPPKPADADQN